MLHSRSAPVRALCVAATLAALGAAVPMAVDHHADHPDEAVHLEHDHGGHGGLLEQDEARIPAPDAPATPAKAAFVLPDGGSVPGVAPERSDFLHPLGRAPPPDLPRAPPLPS